MFSIAWFHQSSVSTENISMCRARLGTAVSALVVLQGFHIRLIVSNSLREMFFGGSPIQQTPTNSKFQ